MNENDSDEKLTPAPAPDGQEGQEKSKIDFPAMKKAEELLGKLEAKEKQIIERELMLDKKIKQLDTMQAEARISGYGQMRIEESDEEKAIASARKLVAGTGLDPFSHLDKKK